MTKFDDFVKDLRAEVHAVLKDRLAEVTARQDAMMARYAGARGMTFATGSFSVEHDNGRFHLNFPSAILAADETALKSVTDLVEQVGDRHGVDLDIASSVRGGSNYVLKGHLVEAPARAFRR